MAHCRIADIIDDETGQKIAAALLCGGPRPKSCNFCSSESLYQCDFPVGKTSTGKIVTCSLHLCEGHAKHGVTAGVDFCENHFAIAKANHELRQAESAKQGSLIETPAPSAIEEKRLAECGSCKADIYWLRNDKTGAPAPIDAEPSPNGNIVIIDGQYHVTTKHDRPAFRERETPFYTNHFVTCKYKDQHKRQKAIDTLYAPKGFLRKG